jgi:hypothetical protein
VGSLCNMTLEDLKELVASKMEEVELLDFLDISMTELVDILTDQIKENEKDLWKILQ